MAGDSGMAGKVALLLWAQTLGLAGESSGAAMAPPRCPQPRAGPASLVSPGRLVSPVSRRCPDHPAPCGAPLEAGGAVGPGDTDLPGLGDRQCHHLVQERALLVAPEKQSLIVAMKGTYTCDRPDTSRSNPVTVSEDLVVLQVPAWALLEGDTVILRCQGWWDKSLTYVYFYHEEKYLRGPHDGTELSLSPLQLNHSGRYHCGGYVESTWKKSEVVTLTVHSVLLSGVSLSVQPPGGQVALGDRLVLSCTVAAGTGPLSFSWHREGSEAQLGTNRQLELPHVGDNASSQYRCRVSDGDSVTESEPLNVTVLVPVANATITPGPLAHQVPAGDPVTLHCSVQVGSAPVTFTWLHNGQELAQGPLLDLGDIDVGHSGTYQCVATNQLGQDGHRVFRALSPELALEVTPGSAWLTVAAGVAGALLFLLLLVGVIVARHWWHHVAARKQQERNPLDPPAPPEEGEVLYTHVVVTKGTGERHPPCHHTPGSTGDLRGAAGTPREPGDIYGNVL